MRLARYVDAERERIIDTLFEWLRIHAPNERMVMDQFWKGLLAAGELWHELALVQP